MYGILTLCAQPRRPAVESGTRSICGVRFFEVSVAQGGGGWVQKKRWKRAARLMQRAGVRTALFPEGFSGMTPFEKAGIRAAEETYLRQMTAGEIARRAAEVQGICARESCVALVGDTMSAALRRALMELALHFRTAILSVPGGGGEICSVLRREYGVSVLRAAGTEQMKRADVLLTFGSAAPCGDGKCLWLPFGEVTAQEGFQPRALRVRYLLPPALEGQIPEGCNENVLLSLLLEAGAVGTNEMEVSEIL